MFASHKFFIGTYKWLKLKQSSGVVDITYVASIQVFVMWMNIKPIGCGGGLPLMWSPSHVMQKCVCSNLNSWLRCATVAKRFERCEFEDMIKCVSLWRKGLCLYPPPAALCSVMYVKSDDLSASVAALLSRVKLLHCVPLWTSLGVSLSCRVVLHGI